MRRVLAYGRPPALCLVLVLLTMVPGPTLAQRGVPAKALPTYTMDSVPHADIVIALGVEPRGTFTPSQGMMSNLLTAIAILNDKKAGKLLVCGGYTRGHIAEAEMMVIIAQALGVPREFVVLENGSVDTEENARNSALLARRHGWSSAILVAQPGHIKRAGRLFSEAKAFASLHQVIGGDMEPGFQTSTIDSSTVSGKEDALVVHGVSPGFDFQEDPLSVDGALVEMAVAASGLYRQFGMKHILLWHPVSPHGHIRRTEVMAILLASMGVPEASMVLGSARRYESKANQIERLCAQVQAKEVVALLPPDAVLSQAKTHGRVRPRHLDGPQSEEEARKLYRKAGISAAYVRMDGDK